VLKRMNRHYKKEDYLALVKKIRKVMPDVVLTTDIMVGFPGESKEDFLETVDAMRKSKFDMAFLAGYSPRSQTVSYKTKDDVPRAEKIKRERILTEILAETAGANNELLVGKTVRVLIDGEKKGCVYGRTDGYKVVEVKTSKGNLLGRFIMVTITKASAWKLIGTVA
jgi:tRNA-2-methylthio-N6-dimethylallyladenosine synthase